MHTYNAIYFVPNPVEWLTGDDNKVMTWSSDGVENEYIILSSQLQNPLPFEESFDKALDATVYFALKNDVGIALIR